MVLPGDAVVGVHHELERPAARAAGDLGVADRMVVAVLPGDQPGEPLPAALDQVQPGVLVERGVGVGGAGRVEQAPDGRRRPPGPAGS